MSKLDFLDIVNDIIVNDDKEKAIELICKHINDAELRDILLILIDNFQLYGYVKEFNDFDNAFVYESFDYKFHSYDGKIIKHLNEGQLSLLRIISEKEKIFISAPTSFGKTTLILEYIKNNISDLENIIFILPTKSLIEELYMKLLKINKDLKLNQKYNISLNIIYYPGRTIRILTPEKFLNFYEYNGLYGIDFIVMDEAYKIENDGKRFNSSVVDNRSYKFRKVLELISNSTSKVVALSPYTYQKEDSMRKYMEKYRIIDVNRKTKYVYHNYINLSKPQSFSEYFNVDKMLVKEYGNIIQKVTSILKNLYESKCIVYISDVSKGLEIIRNLKDQNINFINEKCESNIKERYDIFVSHLQHTYNLDNADEWYVISALKRGIGIYVSTMPRYVKKEIIELYNRGILKCLFVTTAFIEGVNCNAENIIITSGCTGRNIPLNDISLLNISGRAGRFGKKYVGNVIFIDNKLYERINTVKNRGVSIRNPNYEKNNTDSLRDDYEIEMIDDEFLTLDEIARKNYIENQIDKISTNVEEFKNMSISAPNEWKIKIYNFIDKNREKINDYKEYITNITSNENENLLEAIDNIFRILKDAGIEFKNDFSNVSAFSSTGNFVWGELYKYHIDGNIKKILSYNRDRIMKKRESLGYYVVNSWTNQYFGANGKFNYNKLYEETFKFISNIIEYKIPYYIYLFVSVFIYYITLNNNELNSGIDVTELLTNVENLGVEKEYIQYCEYGFTKEMIEKIKSIKSDFRIDNIDTIEIFDEYEKIMIKEFLELII